jgi:radical SAM superfamily enzyme YgiQ (UPF0313 family)
MKPDTDNTPQKPTTVLMIYPKFPPSFWSFSEAVKLLGKKATMPPTGLATVAAMLPATHFHVLPIVDLNVERLTDKMLRQADLVMVSAMIVQKDSLREIVARAKHCGKPVVVGGPYPTSYRDEVTALGADYLVLDEAEVTLAPFIEDWLGGRAERIYDEHSVRARTTVALTREGKPAITGTPIPRWDLLKLQSYSSLAIQFSRGCPFKCEFCDIVVLYGHQPRAKTPAQMIAELEAIRLTGWQGPIFIVDDNFIGNRTEVRKLLPALIEYRREHGQLFSFFTEASVDLANDNLRDIREGMIEAGFQEIFAGIESTNADVLVEMDKGQNKGDLGQKVETLQRTGFEVTAGFIVGNDSDRPSAFDELFQFIQDNGIVMPMPGLLTALRGTPLYRRLKDAGRLRTESSGNNTHRFQFNFQPKLDERLLIEGYVGLLERLFSPRNYYARCRVLRRRRGPYQRLSRVNRAGILATMRILYRNLIKRPDWEFARFLVGTMFTAPAEVPEAITQAVKFAHFQEITKAAVSVHRYPERVATLTEQFQEKVARLSGDVGKRLHRLAKLEERMVLDAMRLWQSLDRDFRAGAEETLEQCRRRLADCANTYRRAWQEMVGAGKQSARA